MHKRLKCCTWITHDLLILNTIFPLRINVTGKFDIAFTGLQSSG